MPVAAPVAMLPKRYVFIDECGNFDFSPGGSKYFFLNGVTTSRPFRLADDLTSLRFDILEEGHSDLGDLDRFHAESNPMPVRRRVFDMIGDRLGEFRTDCIVVEKCKTNPVLRSPEVFYPRVIGYMLKYLLNGLPVAKIGEIIVITDRIPVAAKKKRIVAAIKTTLPAMLPGHARYSVHHHDGRSNGYLQVVDYIGWAIQRKWVMGDASFYNIIRPSIRNEFDLFRRGSDRYY